jgi:acyl-coenzyme A thioesterase PaaI-like protein
MDISKAFQLAEGGSFKKALLDRFLWRYITFNRPHRLSIAELKPGFAKVFLPYRKNNLNHLKGLHACSLATLAEYTSGLAIISCTGKEFRIIMRSLNVVYEKQGRSDAFAVFRISANEIQKKVQDSAISGEPIWIHAEVPVMDSSGELLCTALVEWQLKHWDKVRKAN